MQFLKAILPYFQIIVSILLIVAVILQQRGTGLSGAFGGAGGAGYYTKRGLEKMLFTATIVLATFFIISTFLALIV